MQQILLRNDRGKARNALPLCQFIGLPQKQYKFRRSQSATRSPSESLYWESLQE
ncbi:hypothetical protein [Altericista sp. CCNU0014]|uniref:hypothetical protein n=1 Tax=Altericista sp. CCNU0014 TaxID=3082949 RepID=UPI00384F179A